MSTKSNLLIKLEEHKGNYVSGQVLADSLGVSRTAIWKAIKELKNEGYPIKSATNKGYALAAESNILSVEAIAPYLNSSVDVTKIRIHRSIDSTNDEAKRLIMNGSSHGTVVIAEEQTRGKGRRGRNFASPQGDSIYISFVLEPMVDVEESLLITLASSLAVVRTIDKISEITGQLINTQIKWVNDIFVDGKKICGILTEAITDLESGRIESLILGIGINVNIDMNLLPKELQDIVGELRLPLGMRNRFAAILINEIFQIQREIKSHEFLDEYRSKSMVLGKPILVIKNDKKTEATAMDIDDRGGLLVKYKTGETEVLHTGEISIRLNT